MSANRAAGRLWRRSRTSSNQENIHQCSMEGQCWDEGALRAYFDRELPPEDLPRIAAHLGECAECHARYNELAARAARMSSFMNALVPAAHVASAPAQRRRPWVRPVAGAALALAAAAALVFVLMPKRAVPPAPVARPHVQHSARPIQAESVAPERHVPEKAVRAAPRRRAKSAEPDYFLALDDDPIDMGVVMRVALDNNADIQADVIFDADGRPRAIRPVVNGK